MRNNYNLIGIYLLNKWDSKCVLRPWTMCITYQLLDVDGCVYIIYIYNSNDVGRVFSSNRMKPVVVSSMAIIWSYLNEYLLHIHVNCIWYIIEPIIERLLYILWLLFVMLYPGTNSQFNILVFPSQHVPKSLLLLIYTILYLYTSFYVYLCKLWYFDLVLIVFRFAIQVWSTRINILFFVLHLIQSIKHFFFFFWFWTE